MSGVAVPEPILIRFDGLEADDHEIDILDLSESLKGLGRIIGVAGHFAATGRYVQHRDAMSTKVTVKPPEAHCFEIVAWIKWAAEEPLISATGAGLAVALITYVFKRAAGKIEEMRLLKDSLDRAIQELGTRDRGVIDRMLDTIDKMADALKPAARQAVSPLGHSARTLTIGDAGSGGGVTLDVSDKDAIKSDAPADIGNERAFTILINELDLQTGSCRFVLKDEPEIRVPGQITDPQLQTPNNPYVVAMAAMKLISVRGKAAIRDGAIEKLYISDARLSPTPVSSHPTDTPNASA